MLSVVSFYGALPIDLQSIGAVSRLNAQLLTLLAAAHPEWDLLAISPEARRLPGVETVGVPLPPSARAKLHVYKTRVGRRVYRRRAASVQSFGKSLWAEAASARLASRPDRQTTVIICIHAEAVVAARRAMPRARIVHWIHNPVVSEGAGLVADAAVVCSVAVYRDTWRRLGNQYPAPMWVIPNWVDVDAFQPLAREERCASRAALGLDEDDLVIVFIDRHWAKGAQVVERALAAIPRVGHRIVLLSAGEPQLKRKFLAPGREVWKMGVMPPAELRRLYGVADVGVVPSLIDEAFGMAALEMMACALPVIASRVGGVPEVIDDGVTGRLVDIPNAVDSWADAIADLLTDAKARGALGAAGRDTVLRRFSLEHAKRDWSRVITHLGSER